jgi:hypothetical protein
MAVAVWAREQARTGTFELAGGSERPSFTLDPALYTAFSELIAVLLEGGVTQPVATLAERFSRLRAAAGAATWLVSALDDVERLLEAYAARSARYDEAELVRLLAELASRARATRRAGAALPARWVLGIGEPAETQLERLRLVSLGARLAADGSARTARVYLADPDSGSVLVLERRWDFVGEPPLDGPELAKRSVVSGINLGALAHGQVVTLAARRTANLGLTIGSRKGTTSLLPGSADPSRFPASLHVTRYEPLRDRLERRPPRFLRPRVLAESLVALRVERVRALGYCAATQTQRAVIEDEAGDVAHVSLSHRAVAPHALDALAARLANNPRAVIGHVQPAAGALHVDPVAVVGDAGMVVLDLAGPTAAPRLPQIAPSPTSPLDEAVESAGHRLAEAAHRGLRRLPADYAARLLRDADRCERLGLSGFGGRLRTLATRPSAATWIDAAIWHGLL